MERALENGVTHLAITDHDCTDVHVNLESSQALSIIRGVEISCTWQNQELHIVGLCIDARHTSGSSPLENLLSTQQEKRRQRVRDMDEKLVKLGIEGLLQYMSDLPAVAQTRSHVADFLVQEQICKTRQKVFKQYLNKSGKAYVSAEWCALGEAVEAITSAGGIAVLAHPGRYGLSHSKLSSLVSAFREAGGEALECTYPYIADEMQAYLLKLATNQTLYVSGGSDFHDAGATWTDVGKFPPLPESIHPSGVWHHPRWGGTAQPLQDETLTSI